MTESTTQDWGDTAPCDVLVIGAGAGGGAVSWRLAEHGLKVVCLEQGGWVDYAKTPSLGLDWEVARATRFNPAPNARRTPQDYPIDTSESEIEPLMWNGVGGSLVHWGAHFPRFRPSDFRVRTLDGVADDWPLDYAELEPYYDLNDRMVGVAGLAGDPGNPPRAPRPMPPAPLGRIGTTLAGAFERLGWHWWLPDLAINTAAYGERGACNHCGPCDLGCPQRARMSTDVTYWPAALALGAQLRTGCRVARISVDAQGTATGAEYYDPEGVLRRQRARAVVVAANGIGTPRLLLMSASPRHPRGLANSSGLVGKRLMHHPMGLVTGVFETQFENWKGPFAVALFCQEFYETDRGRGFVRGLQLQLLRSAGGPLGTALGGYLPRVPWGEAHHRVFAAQFGRTASFCVTTEDLPDPRNEVVLDPILTDAHGLPAPRVRYRIDPNTHAMLDYGAARAREVLREAGAVDVIEQHVVRGSGFHLMGTARMGEDPRDSVVDRNSRAHDVRNLWIADASVFVTAAAVNPTSTLMALALRAADDIATHRDELGMSA